MSDKALTVLQKQKDLATRIAAVEALGKVDCPQCGAPYHGKLSAPYFICRSCRHRWSINPQIEALSNFLEELHKHHPWEWFFTATFARPVSPFGAHHMFARYMEGIQKEMARQQLGKPAYGIDYSQVDGQPPLLEFAVYKPYAFRADEYGPLGGRFHLHALIGNVSAVPMYCGGRLSKNEWGIGCCALHRWPCGYARIFPYDPVLGARFYLSKYITKALGDYGFFGLQPGEPILPSSVHTQRRTAHDVC